MVELGLPLGAVVGPTLSVEACHDGHATVVFELVVPRGEDGNEFLFHSGIGGWIGRKVLDGVGQLAISKGCFIQEGGIKSREEEPKDAATYFGI